MSPAAMAWTSPGHMIVALIAYDHLDPATRAKAVELLRAHPRFNDHFESFMPRKVRAATSATKTNGCLPTRRRGPIWCAMRKAA